LNYPNVQPLSVFSLPVAGSFGDVPEAAVAAFDPRRLTMALQRNGWTKRALAESTGLSAAVINQYERGPDPSVPTSLAELALHLGLPVSYLAAGTPAHHPHRLDAHFRSLRSARQYERQQALATMSHFAELVTVLS
jgi:transcriptional regulator with XRE-family HTH domain